MDSGPGRCWVCDGPGKLWCSGCRFALYCSLACQKKDKARHLDECFNSSKRRAHCSYCGRDETLGGVSCIDCLVCCYCTDSCRKMDAISHKPVCQKAKEKVLEATKKIGDWNRRAKGIPQYMGRLIHAVDYLRWSENEGAKLQQISVFEATKQKKKADDERPKDTMRGRRSSPELSQEMGENPLRILMLGADLKHVLRTLHETPDSCTQGIDITLMDSSPHILARDLLALYLLMLPDAPTPLQDQAMLKIHAERVVMVFYSLCLDMETHALLCNTLHNLLNMTYKSFLHEMRQQVHVDAVTYTLVQAVWSGWMSFANDPSAMQKLDNVRSLKISGKVVKDVFSRYLKSCPKEHHKGISDWIKRGSLKKQKGCHFPNVTLTCFSPLKKEYLDRFEDVNPKWSEETEWIKAVSPEEDMIYAPHGIDMVFQDWDFVLVCKNTKKESNVVEMYLKFLTQVFKKSSQKLLKSNQITINFIRANVKDLRRSHSIIKGKFDRIATGIHADLLGTPFVLQELGNYLNTENTYARLMTHHRVWSLCLNWQLDQQAREMFQKSAKNNKPPDPILMLSSRWSTFRHFLQAELLHHLHAMDGRPLEVENVLPFRDVSHAYDMLLSDYTHHLNRVIPFRFRPEKRMVSMVDSRLHTLEWRRVSRSRRSSAPAAAHPKALPDTQSPEVDPASRYVDNLITLSRNSPITVPPSPPSSDSRPASRLCSRESSLSPCPPSCQPPKEDRVSRPRSSNRPRPRSLYVSTRCKSPLLSSEFDFWEQQNLIAEQKNKKKSTHCSEIPEGIKTRAQLSLEAELKQAKTRAKSAPASPQTKCKPRMVKEKASVFERGSATRSTFPETRKHVDAITPSTPVKKLVLMFSKAFAAKEKDPELAKPLKRSNSFHVRRASFEQGDQPGTLSKDYTNSLKINKAKNALESGMCTLPRKTRPHSIEVSKFSYLESCIDKRAEAINNAGKEIHEKEKKKAKKPSTLNIPDSQHGKRAHSSPIRSLIAGLNTLSVSPVMPRAAKQHKKSLKDTISIKRDELRLVNLRPGSPRLSSPVSTSPQFDFIEAMDWPENQPSLDKSSQRKTPTNFPRKAMKTPTGSPARTPTESPVIARSPIFKDSPPSSPTSSVPRIFTSLRKSFKKIPHEPEYIAPPLYISKSPTFMLHSPSSDNIEGHPFDQLGLVSRMSPDVSKLSKHDNIFSPKPSPTHSQEDIPKMFEKDSKTSEKRNKSGLRVQTIKPDIETRVFQEDTSNIASGSTDVEKTAEHERIDNISNKAEEKFKDCERSDQSIKVEREETKEPIRSEKSCEVKSEKTTEHKRIKAEDKILESKRSKVKTEKTMELKRSKEETVKTMEPKRSKVETEKSVEPRRNKVEADTHMEPKRNKVETENTMEPKRIKEEAGKTMEPKSKVETEITMEPKRSKVETEKTMEPKRSERSKRVELGNFQGNVRKGTSNRAETEKITEDEKRDRFNKEVTEKIKDYERISNTHDEQSDVETHGEEEIMSPEDLMAMTSASMSVSLSEADKEVSDLFPHEESFSPIKPKRTYSNLTPNTRLQENEETTSSENDYSADIQRFSIHSTPALGNEEVTTPEKSFPEMKHTNSPVSINSPNLEATQGHYDTATSYDPDSPHIEDESSAPVYKMVERFAQRIQAEQMLIERPASPKSYNVIFRNSWTKPANEVPQQDKETEENADRIEKDSEAKVLLETDPPVAPPRVKSPVVRSSLKKKSGAMENSPKVERSTKCKQPDASKEDSSPKIRVHSTSKNQNSPKIKLRSISTDESSPKIKLRSVSKIGSLSNIRTSTHIDNTKDMLKFMSIESDIPYLSQLDTSTPRHSSSLRSTPVKELSTPVNKMVEKFALQIQAQSLPPSPRAARPHSIGTLIQQDFLRLYSENPPGDDYRHEEYLHENLSLTSDCCEETMFDLSDDEEEKTGDIGIGDEKNLNPKCDTKSKLEDFGVDRKTSLQKSETKANERDNVRSPSPVQSRERTEKQDALHRKQDMSTSSSKSSVLAQREARCNELRHEFLQKIRGLSDSPIPLGKKKYGEIRSTLTKKRNDILQGEKLFADDLKNSRAMTSSPQLEDMAIVRYTISIDEESITERLRTPPITPRDDPGGAIGLLADMESHGLDGDSQEICSNEYKRVEEILLSSCSRSSSPAMQSPRFNTLPRKSKSNRVTSPTSSLKKLPGKKKVIETDISQHKVQMLKSSRTGGMDKMSFRHFVKTSIANEDTNNAEPESNVASSGTQVFEYTSSVEISTEEFESNAEDVEEAVEAISLTSEDEEPPKLLTKRLTSYNDDSQGSDNSDDGYKQSPRRKSPSVPIRRKRLPSSRSPADLKTPEGRASPKTQIKQYSDDSDNDEDNRKPTKNTKKNSNNSKRPVEDQVRLSPLGLNYSDDARQSPDSVNLNFKVEIPDTPLDVNRDIRRFMWGSLKKKKQITCSRSKTENKKQDDQESCTDEGSTPKSNKIQYENQREIMAEETDTKSLCEIAKKEEAPPPLPEIKEKEVERVPLHGNSERDLEPKSLPEMIEKEHATKSLPEMMKTLSVEDLQHCDKDTNVSMPEKKKNPTTPTIVAMLPKHRAGSPIVGLRLSRESRSPSKSPPPRTLPKPRKRDSTARAGFHSTDDVSSMVVSPQSEEISSPQSNCIWAERPRSWAGMESPEVMEALIEQDSPLEEPYSEGRSDATFLSEENEVFSDGSPVNGDEIQIEIWEEKPEVRPRAGVLKNGRDRSRESRRSLRVSWGDLPERVDSPSAEDCDGNEQQEENERDESEESQVKKAEEGEEEEDNEEERVTQL
ncbi:microtubule-associated protein futsch-like [Palaemon carinicauda]|uniref:microtubule-associated protein futsch-like n=1 Tax=Palaemon carinicauda TaxID=392227 RepID=UPI0035B661DB